MADAQRAVKMVVAIVVAGLMAAFLIPIVIGAIGGPATTVATLDVGNSTELQPNMTATLDAVDVTNDTATYTITASGQSATATVANGTNSTVTVDGADVTISVTDVSTGQATAEFEYPQTYGWSAGAAALWAILPVIIVLALFLYFTYVAVQKVK